MAAPSIRQITLALAGVMTLGACAPPALWYGGGRLEPGVAPLIRAHYEAHAVEQDGRCPDPVIEGAIETRLLDESADRLRVRIGYRYRDRMIGEGDLAPVLQPPVPTELTCRGFAERDVVLARTPEGLRVLEMTGAMREGS